MRGPAGLHMKKPHRFAVHFFPRRAEPGKKSHAGTIFGAIEMTELNEKDLMTFFRGLSRQELLDLDKSGGRLAFGPPFILNVGNPNCRMSHASIDHIVSVPLEADPEFRHAPEDVRQMLIDYAEVFVTDIQDQIDAYEAAQDDHYAKSENEINPS